MSIEIISANPFALETGEADIVEFSAAAYHERIGLLRERMAAQGITHAVVYGDREYFANVQYLCGYDPRFEETLLIIGMDGDPILVLGNEGLAYSFISPISLNRVLYQNLSLQGQPREKLVSLESIFSDTGIGPKSKVGVVGNKYFSEGHVADPVHTIDIPAYMAEALHAVSGRDSVINFTAVMTGLPDGIRLICRTADDVAFYEYHGNKVSNVMISLLKNLKPGRSDIETSKLAGLDATPLAMFPFINFGPEQLNLGLASPRGAVLEEGDVAGLCYCTRGALVSKVGVASKDESGYKEELTGAIDDFFKPHFSAVATWLSHVGVGVRCGDVFDKVMAIVGDPKFNVYLNPGHNIGGAEWTNAPFYKDSDVILPSGYYLQTDIIASTPDPVKVSICEDGVILADESLRNDLESAYPEAYARILARRTFMIDVVGIDLDESVLPMSNLCGVYFPFLLNHAKIFAVGA